jgi:hypothetical protein
MHVLVAEDKQVIPPPLHEKHIEECHEDNKLTFNKK